MDATLFIASQPMVDMEVSVPTYKLYPAKTDSLPDCAMRLWPQVFGFAMSLGGGRHRAEDLCQEAFLRLFEMKRPVL